MTASQIARMLHGVRAGRGYQCKCPNAALHAHGDRSRSLSVREMGGWVRFKCFAGCSREEILGAMGLEVKDLALTALPNKDAIRLAEKMRAEVERKRCQSKREAWQAWDRARKWEAVRDALGLLLIQRPSSDRLNTLFHYSCERAREVEDAEKMICLAYDFRTHAYLDWDTPSRSLAGITASDVGPLISKRLKLEEVCQVMQYRTSLVKRPDWMSIRLQTPETAATSLKSILSAYDPIEKQVFAIRGMAMLLIEERELYRFVIDEEVGDYYQSFDRFIKQELPNSWGYCREALRTIKELKDTPFEDLLQIRRCNLHQLTKVSSGVRLLPDVVKAAKSMPEKAFVEKLNQSIATP